jgi:hypothetical protein
LLYNRQTTHITFPAKMEEAFDDAGTIYAF